MAQPDGVYDYIIVEAGSAGRVLAARLTGDSEVSVALIEAGPPDTAEEIHIPVALASLFKSRWDWDYDSEPEPALGERRAYLPAAPDSAPRIRHNSLTTEEDRQTMLAGVRIALEIAGQPALKNVITGSFTVPESASDDDLLAYVRGTAQTVYHPTSTCPMGAVVDSRLRVLGLPGLRVVDAAVMPTIPRGNTNAATIMIAEKAADMIREDAR